MQMLDSKKKCAAILFDTTAVGISVNQGRWGRGATGLCPLPFANFLQVLFVEEEGNNPTSFTRKTHHSPSIFSDRFTTLLVG